VLGWGGGSDRSSGQTFDAVSHGCADILTMLLALRANDRETPTDREFTLEE